MSDNDAKATWADKYAAVADAINRTADSMLPSFGWRYYTLKQPGGEREILKEIDRGSEVVAFYSMEGLTSDILTYCCTKLLGNDMFAAVETKHAKNAADYWRLSTPPIPEPAMVRARSEEGLCYHRLDFDPDVNQSTPLFDEFLGRCSDPDAVMCFIGSLFYPEADRQQYLWFWGAGQNGKGALQRFLARIMGPSYISTTPPGKTGDKFWTSMLLGKRLVVFADCADPDFPVTGLFKSLTGGDMVRIEKKREHAFSTYLNCKFLFSSNERPSLTGQKADIRRAIYVEVEPITGDPMPQKVYDAKLWAEAAGVVGKCREAYLSACGSDGAAIPIDDEKLQALIEANSDQWSTIWEMYFSTDSIHDSDDEVGAPWFTGKETVLLFEALYGVHAEKKRRQFLRWLRDEKNITREKRYVRIGGETDKRQMWVYLGGYRTNIWPCRPGREEVFAKESESKE